jgi:hypothetical protein
LRREILIIKIDAMMDAARNLFETINNLKGQTGHVFDSPQGTNE